MHKKLLKKGIALILAAVMAFGCAPKSARADDFDDTAPAYGAETEASTQTEEEPPIRRKWQGPRP